MYLLVFTKVEHIHNIQWWWILYVSLTGLGDAQIADKTFFLGVSRRVFPEEASIWIGELNEADGPTQCGWVPSNPLRVPHNQKAEELICSLLELRHPPSPAPKHQHSWFSGIWNQFRTYTVVPLPQPFTPHWSVLSILLLLIGQIWVRIGILLACFLCLPSFFVFHIQRMWPLLQPWGCEDAEHGRGGVQDGPWLG